MTSNLDATELITDQEERDIDGVDFLQSKLASETQEITIREVGVYMHPLLFFRGEESNTMFSDSSEEEEYSPFEYDQIELPNSTGGMTLLSFVIDSEEHTTDEFDEWMNKNSVPEDVFNELKTWLDETDRPLSSLYFDTRTTLWKLSENSYNTGVLSPIPMVSVLFEDSAGVQYLGMVPVLENEERVQQFFNQVLVESEQEIVNEQDDEDSTDDEDVDDDDEPEETETETVYITEETTAEITGRTVTVDDVEFTFDILSPLSWYAHPQLSAAIDSIDSEDVTFIQSFDASDGWYKPTVPVSFEALPDYHQMTLKTPFDYTDFTIGPTLSENSLLHTIIKTEETSLTELVNEEGELELEVWCRPFFTSSIDTVRSNSKTSRTAAWVVDAPHENETSKNTDDTVEQKENDEDTEERSGLLSRLR